MQRAFRPPALRMIEQANAIIDEYQAQGFVMILRQIHYQFVARDLYANTKKNYRLLGTTLQDSRNCGLTDWDAIEDRTRTINGSGTWGSPAEITEASARQYREDLWAGQGHRVEVWIEKDV